MPELIVHVNFYIAAVHLVLSAVEKVVNDDMFTKVPSQNARAVLRVGTMMGEWLKDSSNEEQADRFAPHLFPPSENAFLLT